MFASNGRFHPPADTGLLLVGHGTRDPAGVGEFLDAARRVSGMAAGLRVEPGFLEFAEPTIATGFRALVGRDVRRIVVVPVLLFSAGHAKRDIPAAVAAAAAECGMADVRQCDHLGCHEAILRLSAIRYQEAIARHTGATDEDTALVMVGRGSRDEDATAEMRRFVEMRAGATNLRRVGACFVAMAEPGLTAALDEAVANGARRIVVQPHLLFGGVLVDRIRQTVEIHAGRYPHITWVTAAHLGPSDLVAAAVLDRAGGTLSSWPPD